MEANFYSCSAPTQFPPWVFESRSTHRVGADVSHSDKDTNILRFWGLESLHLSSLVRLSPMRMTFFLEVPRWTLILTIIYLTVKKTC